MTVLLHVCHQNKFFGLRAWRVESLALKYQYAYRLY
jgi:hypothetical protein